MNETTSPHLRIAAELRAELARQRIPQSQVAEQLGMTQVSVSRRLRGETPLDVNELTIIAGMLGAPASRFLSEPAA